MNKTLLTSCLLIGCIALPAQAGHKNNYQTDYQNQNTQHFYDFARVSSAQPIVETIQRRAPVQCNYSSYPTNHYPQEQRRSATSALLGGLIGAAIGNELGHKKSNKRVGAVAGGLLGASIGSDLNKRSPRYNQPACKNQYDVEYHDQVVGYNVQYRYKGNTYYTQTREHPGKRLQLKLRFEPVI